VTGISERAIQRMLQTYRSLGDVARIPMAGGRPRILNGIDLDYLESHIERRPDIYLHELRWELISNRRVEVDISTISRSLRRRGYTRKKLTRPAIERDEDDRLGFEYIVATYFEPEQLVFLDESACDRRTARRPYGWAVCGDRSRCRDFFVRGKRYSILPAMSLDGVVALGVQEGALTRADFTAFLEMLLDNMNPFPQQNSVIVMDNAQIHKGQQIRDMVAARGMRVLYLPAYSPDYNPLEEGFSAVKAWVRRERDYARGELDGSTTSRPYAMLWEAVYGSISPEKARSWFRHSGYLL